MKNLGVLLFAVLSAFCITGALEAVPAVSGAPAAVANKDKDKKRDGKDDKRRDDKRRRGEEDEEELAPAARAFRA